MQAYYIICVHTVTIRPMNNKNFTHCSKGTAATVKCRKQKELYYE
jgi:hypothetical protein